MHLDDVQKLIQAHPDFPEQGILFQDIFPIFRHPAALQCLLDNMLARIRKQTEGKRVDVIVGLDARGFLFGPALALALQCAFVPVRKAGKLPGKTERVGYQKEYGVDYFEMQAGAIPPGSNCVIVDDLLATGGSAYAAAELVSKEKSKVIGFCFAVELDECGGRAKLLDAFSSKETAGNMQVKVEALFHF